MNSRQSRKIKGALHVHSAYSDGEFTMPELRDIFLASGCEFVCMTDHAEAFDEERLRKYITECERLSDSHFRFVPGLEFQCENKMHILGYGITTLLNTGKPQEVIARIHDLGGVSVIAHPAESAFPAIKAFEVLPLGIEVWNSKYDGRYAPRPQTFRLLHDLQRRKPEMRAFYGQDLHWRQQFRGLLNLIDSPSAGVKPLLNALHEGRYIGFKADLEMSSSGALNDDIFRHFARVHRNSDRLRHCRKQAAALSRLLRFPVPTALKHQLRKIF